MNKKAVDTPVCSHMYTTQHREASRAIVRALTLLTAASSMAATAGVTWVMTPHASTGKVTAAAADAATAPVQQAAAAVPLAGQGNGNAAAAQPQTAPAGKQAAAAPAAAAAAAAKAKPGSPPLTAATAKAPAA
ncbi:MAG: hypothetical protein QOE84_292, partial [Actinomycetota bacterium]|nr:hypothetical protein [Actinomycetota bacterium]